MKLAIAVIAAAALAGVLALQHRSYVRIRNENSMLRASARQVEELRSELATNSVRSRADQEIEIASLREQTGDLLKLRGEVSQWRNIRSEFEEVQREHERLLALQPGPNEKAKPGYEQPITLAKEQWLDRGTFTPEATLETFFWAVREWNTNRLTECVVTAQRERFGESLSHYGEWANYHFVDDAASINLVARRQPSPEKVEIGVEMRSIWSMSRKAFMLIFEHGEWKLDVADLQIAVR